MVTQVSTLYPVKPLNESKEKTGSHNGGKKAKLFLLPSLVSSMHMQNSIYWPCSYKFFGLIDMENQVKMFSCHI